MARFFLILLLSLSSLGKAYAAFYFDRDIEYLEITPNDWPTDNIDATVTVNFLSVCSPESDSSACKPSGGGQQFSLGVSDQGQTPGPVTAVPLLETGSDFNKRVKRIKVSVGSEIDNKDIYKSNNPSWISGNTVNPIAIDKSASFTVRLKKSELENFSPGTGFSIYFYGLSTEPVNYLDVFELRIRINETKQVKISKLNDVTLTESNVGPGQAVDMNFCVYVSGGYFAPRSYLIRANGLHEDQNNNFNLSNGDQTVVYKMDFSHQPWFFSRWEGPVPITSGASINGRGSITENCDNYTTGINAKLAIYLLSVPSAAGIYTDTITLTVIPD